MVNAGVSLQSLMALLGHVSAEMSLRYGRLFDQTVRAEYERALDLAKARIGPLPERRTRIPVTGDGDWRQAPALKARLAGGYCLRAPAQGACPYANICEHCPNFRTDAASAAILSAQRVDATRWLLTPRSGAGSKKPNATVASSPASTLSSAAPRRDDLPPATSSRRERLRPTAG